jgi:hypothetical protein
MPPRKLEPHMQNVPYTRGPTTKMSDIHRDLIDCMDNNFRDERDEDLDRIASRKQESVEIEELYE